MGSSSPLANWPAARERYRAGALFLLTAVSVFAAGYMQSTLPARGDRMAEGLSFASTLLAILLAHEFGHYIAARIHNVDASLPHFIPMPLLSPFGTMGAVIQMRGALSDRRALLDIGAAGPLAGMLFAVPLYAWGSAHSSVVPMTPGLGVELGESLLVQGLDRLFHRVPQGHTLLLSPMAFAAWGGMLVTMINLVPVGQLDGGHVLYALLGERLKPYAKFVHASVLVVGLAIMGMARASGLAWHAALNRGAFWMLWFIVAGALGKVGGGSASGHPPTDNKPLGTARICVGIATLLLFVLLFMPTPMAV